MSRNNEPFKPGYRFVKYDIIGLLGMGGHAHVYDAHDPFLDRDVALKVIRAPKGAQHNLAKRAQSEARVLVRIDHPNVVRVFDAGATDDGLVYLVMEKLEGRTLRAVYQDVGRLSVVEALELATQICAGVHAAHQMDVIHRDLKPENVFVQQNNRVKVLDFGISKVMGYGAHDTTQRHMLHGTVLYMSPEHLQGFGVTRKSDVFSLGTLLYEGLHKHPVVLSPHALVSDVHELRDMRQVIYSQLKELPPMLHEVDVRIHRHVARFVQRAILKASEQRYETMAAMLEAALQARERLEREEGADYVARSLRDLSRPQKRRPQPQQDGDTLQVAMRFSTEIEPVRSVTQPGGLTPPAPLSVTTPLSDHISGLPFQTTTPVPALPGTAEALTPRPQSARPAVIVPSLKEPAQLRRPADESFKSREVRDSSGELPTESLLQTPAQSATLALAEQVTRTAGVDQSMITELASGASLATPHSAGTAAPSVVPVSHTSARPSPPTEPVRSSEPDLPRPWRKRLSVRVVLATGATLGLSLGIGFSVASMRAPLPSAVSEQHATTSLQPNLDAEPADPPESHESRSLPAKSAHRPSGGASRPSTQPLEASQEVPNSVVRATATTARARASAKQADSNIALEAMAEQGQERSPSANAPAAKASSSAAANGDQPGSWLKPEMIHFPDDSAASSPGPRRDRMPSSGLD